MEDLNLAEKDIGVALGRGFMSLLQGIGGPCVFGAENWECYTERSTD